MTAVAVIVGFVVGGAVSSGAEAEAGVSPVKALDKREVYYPGTEVIDGDTVARVAGRG